MCQAWDGAMMMYYHEGKDKGFSQGIDQGIQKNQNETILRMLSKNKYTYEEIAELNNVTAEAVRDMEMQLCG